MENKKVIMKIESYSHKDGVLVLSVSDWGVRSALKGLVEWCEKQYGSFMKLEMSPPYRPKTKKELRKFWAMCTEYARHTGSTKDKVSEGVKYRAMDEGLWEGVEVPFQKHMVIVPMSIADSDTKQLSVLIDVLYRIAAEDGYEFKDV